MDCNGTQKQALETVSYLCIDCALLIVLFVLSFVFVQKTDFSCSFILFAPALMCILKHVQYTDLKQVDKR